MGAGSDPASELGPGQNQALFDRLKGLVADCQQQGLRLLSGGLPQPGPGYFFPVTLVDNPPDASRIVQEEPFGPILPLLRFTNVDDAIRRANQSPFGLGGSVWCRDQALALSIAQRLQTGTVWVNEIHTLSPHRPMAGHKQSGVGVEQGIEGLLAYTQAQTLSIRRQPS
jgi:acyl-CoA reductase-like NAD-dependent aldehyde dehydrogenase